MKRIAWAIIYITGAWLLFGLICFWANSIIDSYFYWAFAEYVRTGAYPFAAPFIYSRPTTISPPLYSLLMAFLQVLPAPDVILRLLQTVLLLCSGYFVYRSLKHSFQKPVAAIAASLFILIPANTVYVNYLLTEIPAQFFVALLMMLFLAGNTKSYGKAMVISAVATLSKYSLVIYAVPASLWYFFSSRKAKPVMYPVLGAVILAGWISVNWSVTGVLGLSDSKGIQLYNQLVWIGGVTPRETSSAMRRLRQYVPASVDIRKAYWDLQPYILPASGNSWHAVDTVLGSVATEALREHPVSYLTNTVRIFITLHGSSAPYWGNIGSFGKPQGPYPLTCGMLGTFRLCHPLIRLPGIESLWDTYIAVSDWFYAHIFPFISYVLFFPSLAVGFFTKDERWKRASLLYVAGVLPIAMYVHPDTRYIIPFYPLYTVICVYGLRAIKRLWPAKRRNTGGTER